MPNLIAEQAVFAPSGRGRGELTIRAQEPGDCEQLAELANPPKVRWGTLQLPFVGKEQWRRLIERAPDGITAVVGVVDGRLVGSASVTKFPGRRSHVGKIGICVHDDFHGRGIGSALMSALTDLSDNWLNLRRLELTVYVDNEPAIRL